MERNEFTKALSEKGISCYNPTPFFHFSTIFRSNYPKIALLFLFAVLTPLLVGAFVLSFYARQNVKLQLKENFSQIEEFQGLKMELWHQQIQTDLGDLAGLADFSERIPDRDELSRFLGDHPSFLEIQAVNRGTSRILASSNPSSVGLTQPLLNQFSKDLDHPFFSPVLTKSPAEENEMIAWSPIKNKDGKELGVLLGLLNLQSLHDLLTGSRHSDDGIEIYPLAGNLTSLTGEWHPVSPDVIEKMTQQTEGEGIYRSHSGKKVFGSYRYFPDLNLYLLIEQPTEIAFSGIRDTALRTFLFLCAVAVVTLLVSIPVAGNLYKPATIPTPADDMETKKAKQISSEFVSIASHLLRTPVSGTKWILESLKIKGGLESWQSDYLDDAIRSNERMVSMVNNLICLSRLEAGICENNPEEIDLVSFVEGAIHCFNDLAKQKNQRIEFSASGKRIMMNADSGLLEQILNNLLSNALIFSGEGKTVWITAGKNQSQEAWFRVRDEGIGVSKADRERLFDPFFRTKESIKIDTTKSGLGLRIVKKTLEVCGGRITVRSSQGKGSVFTVYLPDVGRADPPEDPQSA
jgi:signal transduction histidine kinase